MNPVQQAHYLRMINYLQAARGAERKNFSSAARRLYQAVTGQNTGRLIIQKLLSQYLANHGIRKLMLGAGYNSREGWLVTDIARQADHVMYLDVTRAFPFEDGTFDYIHAEHLIEHISWYDGLRMLRECRRVLKPGGAIRIATPDLGVLISLYGSGRDRLGDKYIEWITDTSLDGVDIYRAAFVINNAFTNWGHKFLYDGELLKLALERAGLTNIRQFPVCESDDVNLRGLESHGEIAANEEMVAFETMVFEATKAASNTGGALDAGSEVL